MRLSHWCMLGATVLLLLCEIAISQLCKSLITMVDGFHTLFILIQLVLPLPHSSITKPQLSSVDSSASPPHASSFLATPPSTSQAESPRKTISGTQTTAELSTMSDEPDCDGSSPVSSQKPISPARNYSVSFPSNRIQPVGVFISSLLLVSLSISYFMEIISFILTPHPVQRPLLPVVVGTVSLLHKMLLFGLNWDQVQDAGAKTDRQTETESHLDTNHRVLAEEGSRGQEESEDELQSKVQTALQDSLHGGALVLCNPGTSSIPGSDCKTLQQETASEEEISSGELKRESHSKNISERCCMGHPDHQNSSKTSSVCESCPHSEGPAPRSLWPVCLMSSAFIIQGLFTSLLALINSLVTLMIIPQFQHSSGICSVLVYLDPGLSLLAVFTLISTSVPQVYRYGLLLLQASPPHICVSDLGQRIASVPGVQDLHDLHIWHLNETLTVASVHVHCYAGYQVHRCADLISGVTKVLQSVGVSYCTIQPEFASCSGFSSRSSGDASPVIHRDDPSPPLLLPCSLACGRACAGSMCCSLLEEEAQSVQSPTTAETKEEPQILVIENTFL